MDRLSDRGIEIENDSPLIGSVDRQTDRQTDSLTHSLSLSLSR